MYVAIKKYITVSKDGNVNYETTYISDEGILRTSNSKYTTLEEDKAYFKKYLKDKEEEPICDKISKFKFFNSFDEIEDEDVEDEDEEDVFDAALNDAIDKLSTLLCEILKDSDEKKDKAECNNNNNDTKSKESNEECTTPYKNVGTITTIKSDVTDLRDRLAILEKKVEDLSNIVKE